MLLHTRSVILTWQPDRMAFGDYKFEIYIRGLSGAEPSLPMALAEWEARARSVLASSAWSYVAGGRPHRRADRGVNGIEHVMRSLLAEADLIMAVDGYPTLKDLTPAALQRLK